MFSGNCVGELRKPAMNPVIDVLDFISRGARQSGETPLLAFSRVRGLLPTQVLAVEKPADKVVADKADRAHTVNTDTVNADTNEPAEEQSDASQERADGLVHWTLQGERSPHGKRFLHLDVSARPILVCQRCMQPFVYPIDSHTQLEVVTNAAALEEDSEGDDLDIDAPDRILAQASQPVLELVEDEFILSLPYIPRHDYACVEYEVQEPAQGADKKPSPFAALAALKKQ